VFESLRQARKWIEDQDCEPVAHVPGTVDTRADAPVDSLA
jgi:hypothetical protein